MNSDVPTNFKITFKVMKTNSSASMGAYIQVGETNKGILNGQGFNNIIIFDWQLGTSGEVVRNVYTNENQWYDFELTYENGLWTLTKDNSDTITYSKVYTTRDVIGVRTEAYSYLKNVLIMPL